MDESDKSWVRTLLQETKWFANTGQKSHKEMVERFKSVLQIAPHWPKALIQIGRYFDNWVDLDSEVTRNNTLHGLRHCRRVVTNFGRALVFVPQQAFLVLPRLLTLWMREGENVTGAFALTKRL